MKSSAVYKHPAAL